jgi:hypothetical protein
MLFIQKRGGLPGRRGKGVEQVEAYWPLVHHISTVLKSQLLKYQGLYILQQKEDEASYKVWVLCKLQTLA